VQHSLRSPCSPSPTGQSSPKVLLRLSSSMFAAISALVALVPLASALVLETPTDWQSSTTANISWVTSAGDPSTFSFQLNNPDEFHNSFAIGNNIPASNQFFSFEMPTVPIGGGYLVEAVNISNINQVFAQTGEFSIAAPPVSVSSSATSSGSASASSASATSSGASSAASSTSPASSSGGSSSAGSSASTSAAGASETTGSGTFNGAARFDVGFGSLAVAAIGAIAGAVVAL